MDNQDIIQLIQSQLGHEYTGLFQNDDLLLCKIADYNPIYAISLQNATEQSISLALNQYQYFQKCGLVLENGMLDTKQLNNIIQLQQNCLYQSKKAENPSLVLQPLINKIVAIEDDIKRNHVINQVESYLKNFTKYLNISFYNSYHLMISKTKLQYNKENNTLLAQKEYRNSLIDISNKQNVALENLKDACQQLNALCTRYHVPIMCDFPLDTQHVSDFATKFVTSLREPVMSPNFNEWINKNINSTIKDEKKAQAYNNQTDIYTNIHINEIIELD